MRWTICPKCHGDGVVMDRAAQIAAGLFTLGMVPLLDAAFRDSKRDSDFARRCPVCSGRGKVAQERWP